MYSFPSPLPSWFCTRFWPCGYHLSLHKLPTSVLLIMVFFLSLFYTLKSLWNPVLWNLFKILHLPQRISRTPFLTVFSFWTILVRWFILVLFLFTHSSKCLQIMVPLEGICLTHICSLYRSSCIWPLFLYLLLDDGKGCFWSSWIILVPANFSDLFLFN